ncbi:carboxypeptidase-like regulatory domain-containing protein [Niabella hibiscisoli]|uniref:carboxypeptidase-like regulatory domain-containing protein n=1 Tax=Niabella hibiscisoli TaxID=1825928 RepID=UPI001F0EA21A|nr:carboxypeptidase-like regulatory domain-containing protein [Niabella hibiscisoli]MCH5720064.1 carboxypeptidase-like regulatory domain-containing protein [Niabella hibiscisoli]
MNKNFFHKGILVLSFLMTGLVSVAQDGTVLRGVVYDKNGGKPLSDVSVMIVNANNLALNGNKTNEEGKFEIVNSKGGSKIAFSNMGYQTQEKEIGDKTFSPSILQKIVAPWRL